jgi:hypothetical protein
MCPLPNWAHVHSVSHVPAVVLDVRKREFSRTHYNYQLRAQDSAVHALCAEVFGLRVCVRVEVKGTQVQIPDMKVQMRRAQNACLSYYMASTLNWAT